MSGPDLDLPTTSGGVLNVGFRCPKCGGTLTFTRKLDREGQDRWFIHCFSCAADGLSGGDYVRALAQATGVSAGELLASGPPESLGPPIFTGSGPPTDLPSNLDLSRWHADLFTNREALAYLRAGRGLTLVTIKLAGLGYDGTAFVIPCADSDGYLCNVRRRAWPTPFANGSKIRSPRGHPASLYPDVPAIGPLVICAGEFDALVARQAGIPAATTTCGASVPDRLIAELRPAGREVAVVFDVGEEGAAERVVVKLVAAGADAWRVDLGLGPKEDLTDWFVTHERSATRLLALIRSQRSSS